MWRRDGEVEILRLPSMAVLILGCWLLGVAKAKRGVDDDQSVRAGSLHRPTMLGRHGPHIVPPCWPLGSEPLHFCLSRTASSLLFVHRPPPPPSSSLAPRSGTHSSQSLGFLLCAREGASLVCLRGTILGHPARWGVNRGVAWIPKISSTHRSRSLTYIPSGARV